MRGSALIPEKENIVKLYLRRTTKATCLMIIALSALFAPGASACAPSPRPMGLRALAVVPALRLQNSAAAELALREEQDGKESSIVGLWRSVYVSGGAVLNLAFDTWHNDGTEMALDGSAPPA